MDKAMKKRQCSRQLPKPVRLFLDKGKDKKNKLAYVIYPDLSRFKLACHICKFRIVTKGVAAGTRSRCRLEDKDFSLKFYGIAPHRGVKTWFGTIPPSLRNQYPKLYEEIVSYFEKHRVRSLRRGVLQSSLQTRQNKPRLADGTDISLAGLKQPDSSEGIEKPSKPQGF